MIDADATITAMNVIQWALDSGKPTYGLLGNAVPVSPIGREILTSALGHLRRSLREYLTRGGK